MHPEGEWLFLLALILGGLSLVSGIGSNHFNRIARASAWGFCFSEICEFARALETSLLTQEVSRARAALFCQTKEQIQYARQWIAREATPEGIWVRSSSLLISRGRVRIESNVEIAKSNLM